MIPDTMTTIIPAVLLQAVPAPAELAALSEGVALGEALGNSAGPVLPVIATPALGDGPLGIPALVLDAYQFTERTLSATRPGCQSVLAGIGHIESVHASDGRLGASCNTLEPILGPRLDGSVRCQSPARPAICKTPAIPEVHIDRRVCGQPSAHFRRDLLIPAEWLGDWLLPPF
jgi:hypothetical protein